MTDHDNEFVWVFNGEGTQFPSGVFRTREKACVWIATNAVSGVLTAYPIDEGAYDWAVRNGTFVVKSAKHRSPEFIQKFAGGAQPHAHFEHGKESGS